MDLKAMREETLAVPIPEDPVMGREGHLKPLWRSSLEKFFDARDITDV